MPVKDERSHEPTNGRKKSLFGANAYPHGELLFEFVRASDRALMACDLLFHGDDAYGFAWEVQFFERGELFYARGGFAERWQAVQWATEERKDLEGVPPGNR